jgi:hypothetical protein
MEYNLFFIKIIDVAYINFLSIILSIITGIAIDYAYGPFDEEQYKNTSTYVIVLEITIHIILLSLLLFFCRRLMMFIYSPFSIIKGYDRSEIYQVNNATVFTAMMFMFQNNLMQKIAYFHSRLNKGY